MILPFVVLGGVVWITALWYPIILLPAAVVVAGFLLAELMTAGGEDQEP